MLRTAKPSPRVGEQALAARLGRELEGDVLFDAFSRGRYSTDASIYQIEPIGVVVPRNDQDIRRTIEIAADEGTPVLARVASAPARSGCTLRQVLDQADPAGLAAGEEAQEPIRSIRPMKPLNLSRTRSIFRPTMPMAV